MWDKRIHKLLWSCEMELRTASPGGLWQFNKTSEEYFALGSIKAHSRLCVAWGKWGCTVIPWMVKASLQLLCSLYSSRKTCWKQSLFSIALSFFPLRVWLECHKWRHPDQATGNQVKINAGHLIDDPLPFCYPLGSL